jgi:ribokinase
VIVVGSVNVDRIIRCRVLPAPGETVVGATLEDGFGGKGANQAAAAATMGAQVELIGRVGSDPAGAQSVEKLRTLGVGVGEVSEDRSTHTGHAFVMVSDDGENSIVVASGANSTLRAEEVQAALANLRPRDGDVILTSAEIPTECIEVVPATTPPGVTWIHNAAPAGPLPSWTSDRRPILVTNAVEAGQLTGLDRTQSAAQQLAAVAQAVIVTMGGEGALLAVDGECRSVRGPVVDVVDTTGAGDVFCGALAAILADGTPVAEALRFAVAAGAYAVTGTGARGALPTSRHVSKLLNDTAPTAGKGTP